MPHDLYHASRQWATRPDDQRFWTLAEMLAATRSYRDSARQSIVPLCSLQARAIRGTDGADELELVGRAGVPARVTHWAFGQLCRAAGAPADYLRSLPGALAAKNLNHGLFAHPESDQATLLIHRNGSLVVRSLTSDAYTRIWDCEVVERCMSLADAGWRVPPARPCRQNQAGARPATQADLPANREGGGGLSVEAGDLIAPAGLYASDHDCFVFLVNESRRLADGSEGGLSRGLFLSNSEVGAAVLRAIAFLYRQVCGNHIVWGAESVRELKIVHRGKADARFRRQMMAALRDYANASASKDEARIQAAQRLHLGASKQEVLDALFFRLRGDLSRRLLAAGFEAAERDAQSDRSMNPRTAWGMAQGLTAYSQQTPYTDKRMRIDRVAGKLLQMAC